MKIDVVVTVYKPEKDFLEMVSRIQDQTVAVNKVIIVNVEQKYYDRLVYSSRFTDEHKNLEVHHISKREFDKGKALNMGFKLSDADYVLVMKQNAVPTSSYVLEKLLAAFEVNRDLAVAYARVSPYEDALLADVIMSKNRFPEDSHVYGAKDIDTLGYKAYMNSNYCALYKKSVFNELKGFLNHVLYNEDVLYASNAINSGKTVAYVSDAIVSVSTKMQEKDVSKLGFDYIVSMLKHPEVFNINDVRDDLKKVERITLNQLKKNGQRMDLYECKKRYKSFKKGVSKGLKYKRIAISDMGKYSLNPDYWRMDEILSIRNAVDVHSGYGRSAAELEMLSKPPVNSKKTDNQ